MGPLDDVRALLRDLPGPDEAARERTAERIRRPDEPPGALGRLGELAMWLAEWTGRSPPLPTRPVIALYAGAHAVRPQDGLERRRLEALAAGAAPVNAMAQRLGAGLDVFDLAVDRPVPDIVGQPAMTERACAATIAFGMEALAKSPDLLLVGEAGGGGDLSAAAIAHALFGGEAGDWTAEGDSMVAAAAARAKAAGGNDPLDILRQLGGREIAAMTGAIVAARVQRTPVVLDGYQAAAAAAVLNALEPTALDHCLAAHASAGPGHRRLLERIGLPPLLNLELTIGEGVGATAALSLIQLACAAAAAGPAG